MMLRKFGHTLFVLALMLAGACFTACNDNEPAEEGNQELVMIMSLQRKAIKSLCRCVLA